MRENEIEINGSVYVKKSELAQNTDGLSAVMVRTRDAGVFFGFLNKRESTLVGIEVELINARRVWYWDGAKTLSQLAVEGTKKPENCKFPIAVDSIELVAIEIIKMTKSSLESLASVSIWEED